VADVLADVKPYNSSIGAGIFYFDSAHFARRRTLPEARFEILQKMSWTGGVRLHSSIRQIPNPAFQLEFTGHSCRELAVTNSLHLAGYPELTRSHGRLIADSSWFSNWGSAPNN